MKRVISILLIFGLVIGVLGGSGAALAAAPASAQAEGSAATLPSPAVADASQMTTVEEVVEEGMVPVTGESLVDGDYPVRTECSSSMFRIAEAVLRVREGQMTADITMGGTAYLYVFPGTALEAATAEESDWIAHSEDAEGRYCFTIPVAALDAGLPCAAFSKNKELWYDRTLLFRADSLPLEAFRADQMLTPERMALPDGDYEIAVQLSGGSGRARIESPARLHVEKDIWTAKIVWGSSNYDYMRIGDTRYLPLEGEETSAFEIPVTVLDRPMAVVADTVAMSTPHEIEYSLLFESDSLSAPSGGAKGETESAEVLPNPENAPAAAAAAGEAEQAAGIPQIAEQFQVEHLADGTSVLTLGGKDRYLILNRDAPLPDHDCDLPVIRIPVERVYAASSSVPDLFLHCGALENIRFTGTDEASWKIPELRAALRDGTMLYAGKYSAPDYELLLEENCDLVIENTMILHNPAVREKLEALGLPVIIEYSSYEPQPLGRVEWIRLYGLLTGHGDEADRFFADQQAMLQAQRTAEASGKTAAFFSITANGTATVRRSADYVTKMIELAGGVSPFHDLPNDAEGLSSVNIGMESFYEQAKDADVLIYNSTVEGELNSMEDLLAKSSLFSDFKAVKNGNVWCTEQSMFQQSSATAGMIADFHRILSGETGENEQLTWLHRIN